MATVSRTVNTSPAAVFAVLADGWLYSNWVVGTSHMRAVEANWPAAGSRLHHAAGVWPAVARDESVVEELEPNHRLVLTAKVRPFGEARVVIELEASGETRPRPWVSLASGDSSCACPPPLSVTSTRMCDPLRWMPM